jgi:hypothetical protein
MMQPWRDPHEGRRRWFEHREVEEGVFLLWEPHVDPVIRGNFWLVRGGERDLLVDGGLGLGLVREELADLFDKPVSAFATHRHFDHIGAMHEFDEVIAHADDAEVLRAGGKLASLFASEYEEGFLIEMAEAGYEIQELLIDELPREGFDPGEWTIAPAPPTRLVAGGGVVDLGDRRFSAPARCTPARSACGRSRPAPLLRRLHTRTPPFLDGCPSQHRRVRREHAATARPPVRSCSPFELRPRAPARDDRCYLDRRDWR